MATIKKRKGTYVVIYRDPDRKQHWETFKKKRDAEKRRAEVENDLNRGRYVAPRDLQRTVGEAWESFQKIRWGSIRKATQAYYLGKWRVHIARRWEHASMRSVGTEAIEEWQAKMVADGTGERTASAAVAMLGRLYKHALRYRWVEHDPASLVRKVKSSKRVRAWTPGEIAAMVAAADEDTGLFIRFAASTGLRFGELAGLKWSDIDLDVGRVSVERQWSLGTFATLKTPAARRLIPMGTEIVQALRLWKLRAPPNEHDLVFAAQEGTPTDVSNFHGRVWRPLLKAAELPHGTFHALRHSYASALIAAGHSPKLVQTLMGHASAAFTLTTYTDLWPKSLEGVGDRVAAELFSGVAAAQEARVSKLLAKGLEDRSEGERKTAQIVDISDGPGRIRTYDQGIMSPLH